jgi:predicted RNA-binding protein YlqC (UPF0109 family)
MGWRKERIFMKNELEKIIKHIVDIKDIACIEVVETKSSITLITKVAGEDYGRIVGSKGRTIELLKDLVDAYSDLPTTEKTYRLVLEEPQTKSWGVRENFRHNPKWRTDEVENDIYELISLFGKVEINIVDTGSHVIFECIEQGNNYLSDRVKEAIEFLTIAMVKGYGRNALLEFS